MMQEGGVLIDGTDSKYVKADIEVYKYGFSINGWYIHQENGGVVVEKDTERFYYTNISLAVKHCLLDGGYCHIALAEFNNTSLKKYVESLIMAGLQC